MKIPCSGFQISFDVQTGRRRNRNFNRPNLSSRVTVFPCALHINHISLAYVPFRTIPQVDNWSLVPRPFHLPPRCLRSFIRKCVNSLEAFAIIQPRLVLISDALPWRHDNQDVRRPVEWDDDKSRFKLSCSVSVSGTGVSGSSSVGGGLCKLDARSPGAHSRRFVLFPFISFTYWEPADRAPSRT